MPIGNSPPDNDWFNRYMSYVHNSESPKIYHEWMAMVTIASIVKRNVWHIWELGNKIYPNLYTVLVGPSGCRKGTAIGPARDLMMKSGVKLSADSITREALIQDLKHSQDMTPGTIGDGSIGSLSSCLTILSPELTVFLNKRQEQLISDLCDWFDCRDPWKYKTKHQGEEEIFGMCITMIGATTPVALREAMPPISTGGGLTSRIIFVYAERKQKLVPLPIQNPADEALREELLIGLDSMKLIEGEFKMTDEYLERYLRFYEDTEVKPPFDDDYLSGYNDRRSLHLRKLSMLFAVSRGSNNVMSANDFDRAFDLLQRTEKRMPYVFYGRGKHPHSEVIGHIMRALVTKGYVSRRDVLERYIHDIGTDDLAKIFDTIVNTGKATRRTAGNDIIYERKIEKLSKEEAIEEEEAALRHQLEKDVPVQPKRGHR